MLHDAEGAAGFQHGKRVGQGVVEKTVFVVETRQVVQRTDEHHHVRAALHFPGQRTEPEGRDRSAVVPAPLLGLGRELIAPAPHLDHEGLGSEREKRPHLQCIVRADQLAFGAQVRQQDAGIPAAPRQRLDHGHARLDAEKFQRFARMALVITRLEIFRLILQHAGEPIGIGLVGIGLRRFGLLGFHGLRLRLGGFGYILLLAGGEQQHQRNRENSLHGSISGKRHSLIIQRPGDKRNCTGLSRRETDKMRRNRQTKPLKSSPR